MHTPPFGQADLTNCERELIHLAGSVQPHGVLLVLAEPGLEVLQASANSGTLLGVPPERLVGRTLAAIEGDAESAVRAAAAGALDEPAPLRCHAILAGSPQPFEGVLHRLAGTGLVLELEPIRPPRGTGPTPAFGHPALLDQLAAAMQRFGRAPTINALADATVQSVRDLTGYDRVMVYKFDPDGHGMVIAEARDPRLESLLNHRYPASDIPQRARELYLRNRVRVLVDAHYVPVPLVPPRLPDGRELDMSMSTLRSMSPLHIQYLRNMGVTATLVVSLVREGQLWGLIAAHHYSARSLRFGMRAAAALIGEVVSTRIAAIENYTHAQVAMMVRRLEQRLIEATSTEGDWRLALFRNPRTLLQPVEATGAALFYDDEILTAGDVPSTPELRALCRWVDESGGEEPFHSSSVGRDRPALASLTPVASGVLAVKLSSLRPDYLMWFRKEQLTSVTWAGDPTKPMVGNDPLELSPRRSFAAWSEIVRGTALPWSSAELVLARAFGSALVDIIVQVHSVRLLIAEHQLAQTRATVQASKEPVLIADADGALLFCNSAFAALAGRSTSELRDLDDVAALFDPSDALRRTLGALRSDHRPWRGDLLLRRGRDADAHLPVSVRADVVPGRDGVTLGFILIVLDRSEVRRTADARRQLEASLTRAAGGGAAEEGRPARQPDQVIGAILTHASLAAMDITDGEGSPRAAPLLQELEASTWRATRLYRQICDLGDDPDAGPAG